MPLDSIWIRGVAGPIDDGVEALTMFSHRRRMNFGLKASV